MSSWVPGRAVHQMQYISLDDAQDMRSQERQRICMVNIGDSGLVLVGICLFYLRFVLVSQ